MKLLKFSASWCGPCKALSNTIANMGELPVVMEEIDIDENMDMARQYGVRGVPTCVLVDEDGTVIDTKVGAMSAAQLTAFLEANL